MPRQSFPAKHPFAQRRSSVVWLVVALTVVLVGAPAAQQPRPGTTPFAVPPAEIRVATITSGLSQPWSLAFLPDGGMLVTERAGRLRVIRNGVLDPQPIAGVPQVHAEQRAGLMGLALHPRFAENMLIYLAYSKDGERGITIALARPGKETSS